ncbi:hypothetical protein A6A04_12540 [Paramagnetospirillum marisnigri]|uniref:AAA domain-containing protein n=1 Tax=Paramagnetospirillum marisnigri TaxID=1285242 RepID=A0A178MV31_9PROT|nr:ParA family protein [Paramagnetospirillum marisnigri]OAN54067.1 hypothetical protein A6A04_12540 [Paramagnetospirillum marisnigri]
MAKAAAPDARPPVMVAVFNQKGGVAKTTTACNLAVCLTAFGYTVLLVDLDTQGNATGSFGVSPLPTSGAFEVITGAARVEDVALDTVYPGLWLLPATISLRDNARVLGHAGRRRGLLETRLAATGVDIVLVDCPPALGPATATALASASAVLMPVRPDPFAHEGLVNTWYEIKRIRETVNPHLGVAGIIMTMAASEPAGADVARVIRAEFGDQVYDAEIQTDPKVAEAAQMGLPVTVLDPDGLAGRSYVDACEELLTRLGRQRRPETQLHLSLGMDFALNRLREWRSTTHAALLRMPGRAVSWTHESGEEDGEGETGTGHKEPIAEPYAPPPPAHRDATPSLIVERPRARFGLWALLFLAGLAAGMTAEALTGALAKLLR